MVLLHSMWTSSISPARQNLLLQFQSKVKKKIENKQILVGNNDVYKTERRSAITFITFKLSRGHQPEGKDG